MDKKFWLVLLVASLLLSGICCKKRVEKGPEEAPEVKTEEYEEEEGEAPAVESEEYEEEEGEAPAVESEEYEEEGEND